MHMFSNETEPKTPAGQGQGSTFLEEKAFRARTVLVFGTITDAVAADTVRRLLALDAESDAPIDMIVSSPGGHLESGDVIHDVVRFITAPVNMIGAGWVGSAATHLYLGAPRERRVCLPQTRFLIHQPSGGAGGQASDIAIQAKEIMKARERIAGVISRESGQPIERVREDIERDLWMSAEDAVTYGLVSRIVQHRKDVRLG
jgi:ATP-dependent Clp protease protease subunit